MNDETIHEEWGSIYKVSHTAKAHLYADCRYIKAKNIEPEDMDKYPAGHLEFCTECKEYFKKWRQNSEADESACARCGEKGIRNKYCVMCYSKIQHRAAKRRL